jgi:aromatic-L-amino-acid decarboxylase
MSDSGGETWRLLAEEAATFTDGIRDLRVVTEISPAEMRGEIERRFDLERPVPLSQLLPEVAGLLRRFAVHVTHPRYFGLFNPSVREAGVAGEALAAIVNPQLAAWSHAPAANEIERATLRKLAAVLGLDPGTVANFTSGGMEANLSAVLAALALRHPEASVDGLGALERRPAIYLSAEGHHSFVKIARMAGLGTDAVRLVPATSRLTMDLGELDRRIRADREAGVERADSVTWDAHKWLSVPMGAGMFFCRHPEAVKQAFAISTSYMPKKADDDTVDPYAASAQWSRRLIGLKVFMALAEIGRDGYGALIEHQADMGDHLRDRLRKAGWSIRNETPLPVVCFSNGDIQSGRLTTSQVLETIYARGRVWISDVVLGGRERVLRACITSFRSNEADIECLIEELEHARQLNSEPG